MLWRESLETSLARLEKEEYVVEVSLRKKPFDFKILEGHIIEWAARLQTLLDSLISLQTHLLPGSAVIEREETRELSEAERIHPNYQVPHILESLEKGMALLRLTVDSKLETQFLIRKQLKDECDGMRADAEKARRLEAKDEEARRERHQLRDEIKQLKSLYDTQHNDLLMKVNDAQTQCSKYKSQAAECEKLVKSFEKDISKLRTHVVQLESERDAAHADTLKLRAQIIRDEETHVKLQDELTTYRQKIAVLESQREAFLLTKIRESAAKPALFSPTITSPTPESTPIPSPALLLTHSNTNMNTPYFHSPFHPISTSFHTQPPTTQFSPNFHAHVSHATNQDTDNLLTTLLHNDTLHKGSLRSTGSLQTEISLAADEKAGDLGLTERLLHARLTSLI